MSVAALDINGPAAATTAEEIAGRLGVPTTATQADVGDTASLAAAANHVRSTLGGCDVLCANVGVQQFGAMLQKMRSIKEGESTLLDNSLVLFGCGFSDGNKHDPNNLPILLGGRGGGVASGRHIASPKNTPLCNLYVSMLERLGTPLPSFGDSTGPLAGFNG